MPHRKLFLLVNKLMIVARYSGPRGVIDFFLQRYLHPLINPLLHTYCVDAETLKEMPNAAVTIRGIQSFDQLTKIDLWQLRRLMTYSNTSTFQKSIAGGSIGFIGYYQNELIGYYCACVNRDLQSPPCMKTKIPLSPGDAYLFDAEVLLPFRRKGLGAAFIYEICTMLFRESVPKIWCEIHVDNTASIRLHEKCGFRFISSRTIRKR